MSDIKTFQQNEILKAEDMNTIGSNINNLNDMMERTPHSTVDYPSRLKVGENLEFDNDDYNNQTIFGKYNTAAPDTEHYLLFAIGDGTEDLRSNAFELLKKIGATEGSNAYDIRIGGISLMDNLNSIIEKLDVIATSINGIGNDNALTAQYKEIKEQLIFLNELNEIKSEMENETARLDNLHTEIAQISAAISDLKETLEEMADTAI